MEVLMSKTSLPFKIKNVFEGFAYTEGVLRISEDCLIFEFITKDAVLGVLCSDVKQIVVAFEEIEEVCFNKSMFGNTLNIRLASLMTAQKIPGQKGSNVKLNIERKNSDLALTFVSHIHLDMSDYHLQSSEVSYKKELSKAIDEA